LQLTGIESELSYLESLVATVPAADRSRKSSEDRLRRLRARAGRLPKRTDVDVSVGGAEAADARATCAAGSAPRAPGSSHDQSANVSAFASFLMPDDAAESSGDKVRLLAAEGRLATRLHEFPVLTLPGEQASYVVRSWTVEDDAEGDRRERLLALLELRDAAATVHEMQQLVNSQVVADQAQFDQAEQQSAEAREQVAEASVVLAKGTAASSGSTFVGSTMLVVGSIVLGAGVVTAGTACGGAAPVACVLVKTFLKLGALGATGVGAKKLSTHATQRVESLARELPRAVGSLLPSDVDLLRSAGEEAERRLLAKLGNGAAWSAFPSVRGLLNKLAVRSCPSHMRHGGLAFSASFTARLPAPRAFQALRRISLSGALDPDCDIVWSRPLEDSPGTSLRYLMFSKFGVFHDFCCVCRCAEVEAAKKWAYAVVSLHPDLAARYGLPPPRDGAQHGSIHVCGVAVTGLDGGGSLVEVMADLDVAAVSVPLGMVDKHVRHHVLSTAGKLLRELRGQEASAVLDGGDAGG